MSDYRKLSTEELRALTTINCCTNALRDMKQYIQKLCRRNGREELLQQLETAAHLAGGVAKELIESAPDEDQKVMIIRRMRGLKLQVGYVRQHPDDMVTMDMKDANLLLAPLFDRCDLECPCLDEAYDYKTQVQLVKMCEVRKALVRLGVSETGLGGMCKYQMLIGGEEK